MSKPHPKAAEGWEVLLASQSPRRAQLLEQLGVRFRVLQPEDAEAAELLEAVRPGERPMPYARRVARAKLDASLAGTALALGPHQVVLCADTTVALGGDILGKPRDASDARHMLGLLSGQTHRVITAVAAGRGPDRWESLSTSWVRFAALSRRDIEQYVASGEPFGKAGAYAIQGCAAAFIEHISGSYSGIMGLPLHETAALLRLALPTTKR